MDPRGVVINLLDCDIVVSEFELQSRHYIHFGKGMNRHYPSRVK